MRAIFNCQLGIILIYLVTLFISLIYFLPFFKGGSPDPRLLSMPCFYSIFGLCERRNAALFYRRHFRICYSTSIRCHCMNRCRIIKYDSLALKNITLIIRSCIKCAVNLIRQLFEFLLYIAPVRFGIGIICRLYQQLLLTIKHIAYLVKRPVSYITECDTFIDIAHGLIKPPYLPAHFF